MKPPKIIGIMQCRNEWGLIAFSISHALENNVDEVYVLNDASSDQTENGLQHLQKIWAGRLHIVNVTDIGFYQEAMINAMIHISRSSAADWIYVFDADEFLVVDKGVSLCSILAGLSDRQMVVKYRVDNFVSVENFDECDIAGYRQLCYRSVPDSNYDPESIAREIDQEKATFFDAPFPSKVIIRCSELLRLRAGSHRVVFYGESGLSTEDQRIRAVHLPLLTTKRLVNKARIGEGHIKRGVGPRHGWQNQLIYKFESEGRLSSFWLRHSIPAKGVPTNLTPSFEIDTAFSESIESTLIFLQNGFASPTVAKIGEQIIECSTAEETMIPVRRMFELTVSLQKQCDRSIRSLRPSLFERIKTKFKNRGEFVALVTLCALTVDNWFPVGYL